MSRYSDYCEKTYSRQFRKAFDFTQSNLNLPSHQLPSGRPFVAVMDCHFSEKSGKKTDDIAWFHNGKTGSAEKGLEFSGLALVDVGYNTAYHLSVRQTPAQLDEGNTRIDFYLEHLKKERNQIPSGVHYLLL